MTARKKTNDKNESTLNPQLGPIDRIVSSAEKNRFTVITAFIYLMVVISIRAALESELFGYSSVNLYYYAWQASYFSCMFMGTVLILVFLSKIRFRKACNVSLFFFWLIIIPPLIDYSIGNISSAEYTWQSFNLTKNNFIDFFIPFGNSMQISWGFFIQGWGAVLIGALYVWKKTGNALKSAICGLAVFIIGLAASKPYPIGNYYGVAISGNSLFIKFLNFFQHPIQTYYDWLPDSTYAVSLANQQMTLWFIFFNAVIFILLLFTALFITSKTKFHAFIGSIRGVRQIHFAVMALIGFIMVRTQYPDLNDGLALNPAYVLHAEYILMALLALGFAWQFTTMINDIYDIEIDRVAHPKRALARGRVPTKDYWAMTVLSGILACCISAVLGLIPFLLTALFLFLGYIYSAPPLRLRDHPMSSAIIGLDSIIAYFIGVFSPGYWDVWGGVGNPEYSFFSRIPNLTGDIVLVGLMILIALTLAPIMTQMRDFEGDSKAGAKTIFTVFGYERGKMAVLIVVPLLFLLPLTIIHGFQDIIVLSSLGLMSFIILLKSRTLVPVFILYFIAALFSLFRLIF